ncbi:MAG: VCBS repeat-containing protein [Planctomycetota bacterium]
MPPRSSPRKLPVLSPGARVACAAAIATLVSPAGAAILQFGPEQLVLAGGVELVVSGYSAPTTADWNNDGLLDLVIGEGGGGYPGKVRVYLHTGIPGAEYSTFTYVQSSGVDLTVPGGGCQGAVPRVVYWDADDRKDLLVGRADGAVLIYFNIGSDVAPTFDGGTWVQVGPPGGKVNIDVGDRANPLVVDWNRDERKDLLIGGLDGKLRLYLNEGSNDAPDFRVGAVLQAGATDLIVSSGRASPLFVDFTFDGKRDLVAGNTEGQLLLYENHGSDSAPLFAGYVELTTAGAPINLPGTPRSRPWVCYWNPDSAPDVLLGAYGGKVHLYLGRFRLADLNCDMLLDFNDITPFALALSDPAAYQQQFPHCEILNGDLNGDGRVDMGDVNPFVAALTGS